MISKKTIRNIGELQRLGLISENSDLQLVVDQFSMAVTATMLAKIERDNADDPIAKQFIPHRLELNYHQSERVDPLGDKTHSPLAGIVHRYVDRVLLMPVQVCPVYCRFCFRRETVGSNAAALTEAQLQEALDYIRNNSGIWEVILTGGDPLVMKTSKLKAIIAELNTISHVAVIRIHTRVPVVDPKRVTSELIVALQNSKQAVSIVLHVNHPNEWSEASEQVIENLVDAGIPLLSQSVLLKGINDDIETLCALMRSFVSKRVHPYYLHHPDLARGTAHFGVSIARGQALMRELHHRISGVCQPRYVLDIPGGFSKVSLMSNNVQQDPHISGRYLLLADDGTTHPYDDHYFLDT